MKKNLFGKFAMAGLVAGAFALSACEDSTSSSTSAKDEGLLGAKSAESFTEECTKLKGSISPQECAAKGTCGGYYFEAGSKTVKKHDCANKGGCAGSKCVVPK